MSVWQEVTAVFTYVPRHCENQRTIDNISRNWDNFSFEEYLEWNDVTIMIIKSIEWPVIIDNVLVCCLSSIGWLLLRSALFFIFRFRQTVLKGICFTRNIMGKHLIKFQSNSSNIKSIFTKLYHSPASYGRCWFVLYLWNI